MVPRRLVLMKVSERSEICVIYGRVKFHTGQCKRTGGCYNELVVAFFSTGGGVKGRKNLHLLTLLFIYKLAFTLFVMTPGSQTTGNIAVNGSAKQLVIQFMVWTANPTKFWSFAVTGAFSSATA